MEAQSKRRLVSDLVLLKVSQDVQFCNAESLHRLQLGYGIAVSSSWSSEFDYETSLAQMIPLLHLHILKYACVSWS